MLLTKSLSSSLENQWEKKSGILIVKTPQKDKKKQSQCYDPARQYHILTLSTGHVNAEVAFQSGSIFALEILVPCVLVTCLAFLFTLYIIVISVCKFHISPHFKAKVAPGSYNFIIRFTGIQAKIDTSAASGLERPV